MKNINLILSILFLFSTGMAASSEAREEAPQLSWVRAQAAPTDDKKYEILKDATDHQIKLPSFQRCADLFVMTTGILANMSTRDCWEKMFNGNKTIYPNNLCDAIEGALSELYNPEDKRVEVSRLKARRSRDIFMAVYEASERIEPQDQL